jgi:hypothetical protein
MNPPRRRTVEPALATDADVAALVAAFEECTLPYENWTHRAHLAVAVSYARALPVAAALDRVRANIQRYSKARGSGMGYHETITAAFLRAVADHVASRPDAGTAAVLAELGGVLDMAWLARHYSADRLASADAKAGYVEPDVRPLAPLRPFAE